MSKILTILVFLLSLSVILAKVTRQKSQQHRKTTSARHSRKQGGPSALIVCADGVEDIEFATIYDTLSRGGFQVVIATPQDELIVQTMLGINFHAEKPLAEALQEEYDVIALPGGVGNAKTLAESSELIAALKKQKEAQKIVAAICASPALVLKPNGILSPGETWTSYPGMGKGADWVDDTVVVTGTVITSQGPATAAEFALKILELTVGAEKSEGVAQQLLANKYAKA